MKPRSILLQELLIVITCAIFAFGGSFTCKGSTHDDDVVVTTDK